MSKKNIYSIILAAGESSRFRSIKQLALYKNESFLKRCINSVEKVMGSNYVVILGSNFTKLYHEHQPELGFMSVNGDYKDGLSSSIKHGVKILPANTDAIMVILVDQPLLTTLHLRKIIQLWKTNTEKIVCTSDGLNQGPPAIIPKKYFSSLLKITGDQGAKHLFLKHKENVIQISDKAVFTDIDTIDDLELIT